MAAFYQNLLGGKQLSPAAALRVAQTKLGIVAGGHLPTFGPGLSCKGTGDNEPALS